MIIFAVTLLFLSYDANMRKYRTTIVREGGKSFVMFLPTLMKIFVALRHVQVGFFINDEKYQKCDYSISNCGWSQTLKRSHIGVVTT